MADRTFYKAVAGVTHGMTHYGAGQVFVGDAILDEQFADNDGKTLDGVVLYEKASKSDYEEYLRSQDHGLVDGSPRGVVGFEPAGEDSLVESQVAKVEDDGTKVLVEADEQAGKPEDGDPISPDSAEAARRLGTPDGGATDSVEPLAGDEGGAGAPPSDGTSADTGATTRKRGSGTGTA